MDLFFAGVVLGQRWRAFVSDNVLEFTQWTGICIYAPNSNSKYPSFLGSLEWVRRIPPLGIVLPGDLNVYVGNGSKVLVLVLAVTLEPAGGQKR